MNILVIGGAKTGTTVISRTIHNSLVNAKFHMEPKVIDTFLECSDKQYSSSVVKMIFEHWNAKPNLRRAIISNEMPMTFDKVVLISRDPRDEAISRMMYFIYPWLTRNGVKGNEEKIANWLNFVEAVEDNPQEYSFLQMANYIRENFSPTFLAPPLRGFGNYRNFCNKRPKNSYLLKYEDFIDDKRGEVEEYLGFLLAQESGLDKLDRTRRSVSYNNWKSFFKQEDLDFFQQHLGEIMEKQGYCDWALTPAERLPKANYSLYIRRLIDERRTFEGKGK